MAAVEISPNLITSLHPSQYISWRSITDGDGKKIKISCSAFDGQTHKGTPLKQLTGTLADARRHQNGVGYVFYGAGAICLDLDQYKAPADSAVSALIDQILEHMQTMIELGPRGAGSYHVFGTIDAATRTRIGAGRVVGLLGCIDILADDCFVTLTGSMHRDHPVADISKLVNHVLDLAGHSATAQPEILEDEAQAFLDAYDATANASLEALKLINTIAKTAPRFLDRISTKMDYVPRTLQNPNPPRWHAEFASLLEDFIRVGATRQNAFNVLRLSEFGAESYAPNSDGGDRLAKLKRLMIDNRGMKNFWNKSVVSYMRKRAASDNGRAMEKVLGLGASNETPDNTDQTPANPPAPAPASAVPEYARCPDTSNETLQLVFQEAWEARSGERDKTQPVMLLPPPPEITMPNTRRMYDDILATMPYPNKVCAYVATLDTAAYLSQRAYFIGRISTSLYMLYLAQTGDGKDSITDNGMRVRKVLEHPSTDGRYKGHASTIIGRPSHGAALHKSLSETPRLKLNIREGHTLFGGRGAKIDANQLSIKDFLLEARTLANKGAVLPEKRYTDTSKSLPAIDTPSVSLATETQPHRFYGTLVANDWETGDLGRWLILNGTRAKRGKFNHAHRDGFSSETEAVILRIAEQARQQSSINDAKQIEFNAEAQRLRSAFQDVCDDFDSIDDKERYALFNRAPVMVQSIAGNLAVIENPENPTVTLDIYSLALLLVLTDRLDLLHRIKTGEAGKGDHVLMNWIAKWCIAFRRRNYRSRPDVQAMQNEHKVPQWFIVKEAQHCAAFSEHPLGLKNAVELACSALCSMGVLRSSGVRAEKYDPRESIVYQVIDLKLLEDF